MRREKGENLERSLAAVFLDQALRAPGCPLCRRVRETEELWVWNILYELTGDPELHERFASSLGLCREHAALMAQVVESRELATPTGVARLYETVVAQMLRRLSTLAPRKRFSREECPMCALAREVADRESWFLGRLLAEDTFWTAYEHSDGLCLPHFLRAWAQAPAEVQPKLLADFQGRLARLLQNLREFQRKERFDVEERPTAEEVASWREALWRLGGVSFREPLIPRGY